MEDAAFLQGVRVVEMGVWVAGPSASGILADWGADVIKVESPAGDPMRQMFQAVGGLGIPSSPPFDLDNRGKRSVALDLRDPEARDAFEQILASADVFVTNLRPVALERLSLDPQSVRERHPRLIYASVTGYGLRGADRDRHAYDVGAFWARSGIAHQLTPEGTDPPAIRGGYGDHTTGVATVGGIMAALYRRERTGKGELVETSLLRTGIYCMGWDLGIQLRFGKMAPTTPRTESINPASNSYRSGDGRWFWLIGIEAERHWPKLVRAIERPELVDDPRCADAASRRHHGAELVSLLDAVFATRDLDAWAERFAAEDVWWAPVQSLEQVVADPQARDNDAFVDLPKHPEDSEPTPQTVATPVRFGSAPVGPRGPTPRLGEHTRDVLAEVGVASDVVGRVAPRGGDA